MLTSTISTRVLSLLFISLVPVISFTQISNLDIYIESQMEEQNIPGLTACVIKDGAVVWQGAYGVKEFVDNDSVNIQTLFTIASLSKLVVATAVLQLEEAGLWQLDDDVDNYLSFEINNPNFPGEPITFRQLLQHRSSLKDSESLLFGSWQQGDSPILLADYVEDHISIGGVNFNPAIFNDQDGPGLSTWYSNYGFALLAYLVESRSGIPYHEYCQQYIFEPLCMESTSFFYDEIDLSNYAIPHSFSTGAQGPLGYYSIANYPAALLKTNIEDLSNFLIAYTQRGTMDGVELFSNTAANLLTPYSFSEPSLGWWNGTNWTYSFYFPDEEVWYHGGFMPGVRTRMNYYSQDSTGIIILTNGEGQYRYIEDTLQYYIPHFISGSPDELPCSTSSSVYPINSGKADFKVFPNPVQNKLQILVEQNQSQLFEIRNSSGQLIYQQDGADNIDCSRLPAGVYWLSGYNHKEKVSRRFVKL